VAHEVNFFDHADIYGGGACEELFGTALKLTGIDRENLFIQSKCGIVRGVMYDLSKEHILASVDGILKRLGTEYLDSLLLHRPDALVEPEEVAAAFDELERSGKVRHFGISNMKPMQIELLKKCVEQPLSVNQLQVSAVHSSMIGNGMEVNMLTNGAIDRDGSVLDYCRLKDITIQAWSPLQYRSGTIKGAFFQCDDFSVLNQKLEEMGFEEGMSSRNKTFILHEMLKYDIGPEFPRITPASFVGGVLPTGVSKITYTVDLSGMPSESMVQGANHDI
jgi:predicted oxidoreductase